MLFADLGADRTIRGAHGTIAFFDMATSCTLEAVAIVLWHEERRVPLLVEVLPLADGMAIRCIAVVMCACNVCDAQGVTNGASEQFVRILEILLILEEM